MSAKDFNQAEKEKVEFKVVSEESTASYALAPVKAECAEEPSQIEDVSVFSTPIPEATDSFAAKGFEKLELIGTGAMGTVWKVRERASGKIFAIKYIIPELASDPNSRRRFEQEAKVAVELHHPNLAAVYGSGIDEEGQPYIQMQYVEGESLAEVLTREGKLSEDRAEDIFNQICEALKYLHAHGIIHRDIKPSNIIIGKTAGGADVVSVTDFGISKSIYEDVQPTHALTQTSDVLGSFLYSSPEQCLGEELTASSDIYSLGCVFYEMLTGSPPFDEKNSVKLIMKQMSEQPDFEKVPPKFRLLLTFCLSKDPKSRARNVENLIEIVRGLEFSGTQYSYSANGMIPYMLGVFALLTSAIVTAQSSGSLFYITAFAYTSFLVVLWMSFAFVARLHSIKTNFIRSICSVALAAIPLSLISMLLNLFSIPFFILAMFVALIFLTKYFEKNDTSNRLVDRYISSCNNKFFLNYAAKFLHNAQFVIASSVFLLAAFAFVPLAIHSSLGFFTISDWFPIILLLVGFSYSLFVFHAEAFNTSFVNKFQKAAKFSLISFVCSCALISIPVAMLWSKSTEFIVKYNSLMFQNVSVAKNLPSDLALLPKDEMGNYARIIALQKLSREFEAPDLANSIADEIINAEEKSSFVKAMAYGYKDVLYRRRNKVNSGASLYFKKFLTELSSSKSNVDIKHPKIFFANLLTGNELENSLGNCLYYVASEAYYSKSAADAKKVISEKKRLKISSGDFPSYFQILKNKVED